MTNVKNVVGAVGYGLFGALCTILFVLFVTFTKELVVYPFLDPKNIWLLCVLGFIASVLVMLSMPRSSRGSGE